MQLALFDAAPEMPQGFRYEAGFLSMADEASLMETISALNFKNFRWHEYTGKRRTVVFGFRYSFDTGKVERAEPIPDFLATLRERAAGWAGIASDAIAMGLITEYGPGAGIGWHRDAPPFGKIMGVSLASDCRFRLRLERERAVREMRVERRSIYLMDGPARTVWQHGIPPGKETRYSITFRTMRERAAN